MLVLPRPLLEVIESIPAIDENCFSSGVATDAAIVSGLAPGRLAETEIVVLRASRVVGPYEDAWDLLRAENADALTGGFMPRNVMFVTGPSRSADIEQTLELGAHGPRRLHVVLVEDDPAARAEG